MLASLVLLENVNVSELDVWWEDAGAENDSLWVPKHDEGDADVSFLTAHSNIHDITHLSHSPVGKETSKMQGKKKRGKHDEG
jgi:hypothetical protein